MFDIKRIDRSRRAADEPLGSKAKFWFYDDHKQFLFKAEERGTGEDWAEKIVCHLCQLLGLPHVHYELAEEWDGGQCIWPRVICETCAPQPPYLILGNQLLFVRDPNYPRHEDRKYEVSQHTVSAVSDAVRSLKPPHASWMEGAPSSIKTALDVFVGYVMLDAWVANQDRHHENWGALLDADLRLAPTFDHGASLARNLSDDERLERLASRDKNRQIEAFARRARSAFYSGVGDAKPLGTVEAFLEFGLQAAGAAKVWLKQLDEIDVEAIQAIFAQIPENRLTEPGREFTLQLLKANRQRLLEESSKT